MLKIAFKGLVKYGNDVFDLAIDTFKEAHKKYPDMMNGLLIPGRWDQQMSPNISARINPMLAYMNPMEKEAAQRIANNLEMEVDILNTTISATETYGSEVDKR